MIALNLYVWKNWHRLLFLEVWKVNTAIRGRGMDGPYRTEQERGVLTIIIPYLIQILSKRTCLEFSVVCHLLKKPTCYSLDINET